MTRVRNQHYVPQFYLRRFSSNGSSVRAWLISHERMIPTASIKGQCSKSFFYGQDQAAERGLQGLDGRFAGLFSRVDADEKDELTDGEVFDLMFFAAIQSQRTAARKQHSDAISTAIFRRITGMNPEFADISERYVMEAEDWGYFGYFMTLLNFPLMLDLGVSLLRNETDTPFVLGDNPVCLQNHFMERLGVMSQRGSLSKGVQYLFPIGPRSAVIVFDPAVYQVGARGSRLVRVRNKGDVAKLNTLSFLNAQSSVYVPSQFGLPAWLDFAGLQKRNFQPTTAELEEYEETSAGSQQWVGPKGRLYRRKGTSPSPAAHGKSVIVHVTTPARYASESFSFVQVHQGVRLWRPDGRAVYSRSDIARDLVDKLLEQDGWREELEQGRRSMGDYWAEYARLAEQHGICRAPCPAINSPLVRSPACTGDSPAEPPTW